MKMSSCFPHRKLLWPMLVLLVAPALCNAQGAGAPTGPPVVSPDSPTAPPEIVKPVLPSEFDEPDTIFRKIDLDQRGYVTLDETKDLIGFKEAFEAVDSSGTGKLTPAQFRKAWAIYKKKK